MTVVAHRAEAPARPAVIGRNAEVDRLFTLVDSISGGGGALLLRGGPGTGKTLLLDLAADYAAQRGARVLRIGGEWSEHTMPWAGLHRLVRPLLDGVHRLSVPQRQALSAAFGSGAPAPSDFLVASAALELLCAAAPLCVIVDDAQWLDEPTLAVLAFVSRRLGGEPIGLLVAGRAAPQLGLPELHLGPLPDAAAAEMLARDHPEASPAARERWSRLAAGNPLALRELPLGRSPAGGQLDGPPLTPRLAGAFASRLRGLPDRTRALLLLLSADSGGQLNSADSGGQLNSADTGGTLAELLAAGAVLLGRPVALADLLPAVDAHLITIDAGRPAFRGDLLRWAVYADATLADRHRAHHALAAASGPTEGLSERRAWHLAMTSSGPDDELADALDAAADRARRRGSVARAARLAELAVQLSANAERQGRRWVGRAELAAQLGHRDEAVHLAGLADTVRLTPVDQHRLRLVRLSHQIGPLAPATARDAIRQAADTADADAARSLLLAVAERVRWSGVGTDVGDELRVAAARLPDAERLGVEALVAPVDTARRLTRFLRDQPIVGKGTTPGDRGVLLGTAAAAVGQFGLAVPLLSDAIFTLRSQNRRGVLADALAQRAWAHVHLAHWPAALADAAEAGELARQTGRPLSAASSALAEAAVRGMRGETDTALGLVGRVEQETRPHDVGLLRRQAQVARGMTLLTAGRCSAAVDAFLPLFADGDPTLACWLFGDLVDAAVRSRRAAEVEHLLGAVEAVAERTGSPLGALALAHARPLLATEADAEDLFREAMAGGHTAGPFAEARLHLGFGEWLRRRRRVAEARDLLEIAHATFRELDLPLWADRAQHELRGSGGRSAEPLSTGLSELTEAERQIAQLAAGGKSNRQIGQQLFISHRTVGSHLYRIYPKLGISSRAQLHEVLSRASGDTMR